jgi:hypothetical protein
MKKVTKRTKTARTEGNGPGPDISRRGRRYVAAYLTGVLDTQGDAAMIRTVRKLAAAKGLKTSTIKASRTPTMKEGRRAVGTLGLSLTIWGPVLAKNAKRK